MEINTRFLITAFTCTKALHFLNTYAHHEHLRTESR